MKAIQVLKPGDIQIVEREIPKIENDDEVLVKVKYAGICGSDIHIYHGTSPVATYPRVIGHEFVGEIVETGQNVMHLKTGDKVVVEPIYYCGKCYPCKIGRPNVCEKLEVLGVHRDGGFQEYVVVKKANAHKFGEHLRWDEAVLIEPFTIACQVTWRGDIREDDFVFIQGAGPIGLAILQYAKYRGGICIVSDIAESKLTEAKNLEADYVINAMTQDVASEIRRITNGMGANVTIDAACTPKTFETAVNVTSSAGRVVVMGFNEIPSQIPQFMVTKGELTICGSRLQTNKFPEVIELFNNRKLNPTALISHRMHYTQIKEAIKLVEDKNQQVSKIILEF
ncbi:zinc-binding alcohol dehydrogenase family protein [Tepidanaerobacter syntrophicus]|uniref:zinc-binding alcohol dehydrogenase family protein n=1 Tax=Tepidanaerobacter syntrophicus TaxID=224999 RepID=UPI001BD5B196|nr:zinc-binding alcohol dehydrogenase family protein [Tepidanaerobacter syntrophicus]